MNKQTADKIITEYLSKIYGFAVKKAFSYDEAEELCSDIIQEVYSSLLSVEEVLNVEGYIWRISEYTYSRFVSLKKKHLGISIEGMEIPTQDVYSFENNEEEIRALRREIAFLTQTRRKIVYSFYFKNKTIALIAKELQMAEGTVKWHLNKARNELKEGFGMERKIGKLGINPKAACNFGHNGRNGKYGGPEYYLADKLNLNIVYSVYYEPKTRIQIAEELGVTPVFIEDKIDYLEGNGFLVPLKNGRYTTYVFFSPEKYSMELEDKVHEMKQKIAERIAVEYVPLVREAMASVKNVYIPGENRELLDALAVWAGMVYKWKKDSVIDVSKYYIKTTDGGKYMAFVNFQSEPVDPDFIPRFSDNDYWTCGTMIRASQKYSKVSSWSVDSSLCSREGEWENNRNEDYEYLYEFIKGEIADNAANAEKYARLRERKFITENNKINIMMFEGEQEDFFAKLPEIPKKLLEEMRNMTLELALMRAKFFPNQMQDLVVFWDTEYFPDNEVALRVMNILYGNGTFKPLTEAEKVTSQLMMFSDVLPN